MNFFIRCFGIVRQSSFRYQPFGVHGVDMAPRAGLQTKKTALPFANYKIEVLDKFLYY